VQPLVSVVIPVGSRHAEHCRVAAASALRQTIRPVEVILVADGGADVAELPGCVHLDTGGIRRGPAAARNLGIARATAPFILFLDADDYLLPGGLATLLQAYAQSGASYVYGDTYTIDQGGGHTLRRAPDYDQGRQAFHNIHVVTALCRTEDVRAVGGFDEGVDAWEDWTLWLRMAIAGYCGHRTEQPAFVYRVHEGDRMTRFYGAGGDLMEAVLRRYRNEQGVIPMARCCGQNPVSQAAAAEAVAPLALGYAPLEVAPGLLRVEYLGDAHKVPYTPPGSSTIYLGTNPGNRYADVSEAAAAWLVGMSIARVVPAPAPFTPAPPPLEPLGESIAVGADEPAPLPAPEPLTPEAPVKARRLKP
jgi:hypothetical protein